MGIQRIGKIISSNREMMRSGGTSSVIFANWEQKKELFEIYNPSIQVYCGSHQEECVMEQSPTLAQVKNLYGEDVVKKWLVIELNDFNSFVGVSEERKMNIDVMKLVADMIVGRYYYLKLLELSLFFFKLKCGEYGEMYGGVDPMRIMSAMRLFINDRNIIIDREDRRKQEEKRKEDMKNAITYEEYARRKKESMHLF